MEDLEFLRRLKEYVEEAETALAVNGLGVVCAGKLPDEIRRRLEKAEGGGAEVMEEKEARRHAIETHENCRLDYCVICDGGLAHCTTCGGFEGGLATECPGVRMTEEQQEAVHAGKIDFRDGEWRKIE